MLGSLRIATIRGIPIRLNVTLLAMFALLVGRFGAAFGIPAGLVTFGSVLLHELGHALVAQRFGIGIAGIDLHLFGGMALMARPPERPREEILIAAAGPFVSLILGASFMSITSASGAWPLADELLVAPRPGHLLAYASLVNFGMAMFNLLPALPMDGGRIFRAALASKLGSLRGTRIAAWVSRAFATLFIVYGFYQDALSLVAIGGLLFLMVGNEERVARAQEAMKARARFGLNGVFRRAPGLAGSGTVIDGATGQVVRETREEFVDSLGRRFVVVTRLVD